MGFRLRRAVRVVPGIRLRVRRRGARAAAKAGRLLAAGGLGSVLLSLAAAGLFFAMVSTLLDSSAGTAESVATAAEDPARRETFYLHGNMHVRAGPAAGEAVITTLERGERVDLGPKDADGWARVYSPEGEALGYLYRESELVRSSPAGSE